MFYGTRQKNRILRCSNNRFENIAIYFSGCCNRQFKMLQHIFLCRNHRFKMLQHVFLDVATVNLRCCNMFFYVATVDLRCCNMIKKRCHNMFFYVTWCFSMLQTLVIECYKQWLTSDPFVFRSISLPHVRQGAVSASAIGSAITITVVYYCITGEMREPEGDEHWVGQVERKPLDPKGKERSGSLWIRKGRSAG
jgi:hypothetical protein